MKDIRKDELNKMAKKNTNREMIWLLILCLILVIVSGVMLYVFNFLEIIYPDVTLKTLTYVLVIGLLLLSFIAISNNKALMMIKDIVLDNKAMLEDNSEMDSLNLNEMIKLKEMLVEVSKLVKENR